MCHLQQEYPMYIKEGSHSQQQDNWNKWAGAKLKQGVGKRYYTGTIGLVCRSVSYTYI